MTQTVLLLTYGSRGDVEPYIALALGLKAVGYRPVLATSSRFQAWISEFGVEAYPLSDALLALIETDAGKSMIEGTLSLWTRLKSGIEITRKSGLLNGNLVQDCWQAARHTHPDLIVFHPKTFAAPHIAACLGIPVAMGVFQPTFVPTARFPLMGMEFLPGILNRASYRMATSALYMFRQPVNELRKNQGLPRIHKGRHVIFPPERTDYPVLHAISPTLLPRPSDWAPQVEMTGFWYLPKTRHPLSHELETFIAAGDKPVFIGFGSMVSSNPQALVRIITGALNQTGLRAVVAKGWAGLELRDSRQVMCIDSVPYDVLFPRMAAVVHHGGVGTLATGLRAGVPSIIVPFFGDQPFWGRHVAAVGVGPAPIPRSRLSSSRLARALKRATTDIRMQEAARDMGVTLASEQGVDNAIHSLSRLI